MINFLSTSNFSSNDAFDFARRDGPTGRTLLRSGPSWTHTPAPATRRRGGQRTSWWWDTVRVSEQKANAPSERNRRVTPVRMSYCLFSVHKLSFIEYNKHFLHFNWKYFCFSYPDCPTGCTPEKEEAAQIGHMDIMLYIYIYIYYV